MVSKYDRAIIEVVNWDKYNPRADVKRPSWFRFEHEFALSSEFFDLDCEQKWLWIIVLSFTNQKNGGPIVWHSKYVEATTRVGAEKQDATLDLFNKIGMIKIRRNVDVTRTSRARHADVTDTGEICTLRDETRRYDTKQDSAETAPPSGRVRSGAGVDSGEENTSGEGEEKKKRRSPQTTGSVVFQKYQELLSRAGIEAVRNAKASAICKQLVERHGLERTLALVEVFVSDTDPFVKNQAWQIGLLLAREQVYLNRLIERAAKPRQLFKWTDMTETMAAEAAAERERNGTA